MSSIATPGASAPNAIQVADWIRERIRRGRMAPGQRLVEVDIIRQTGASRAKVRDAFQRLEVEGLVQIEEYRGASVRSVQIDEVQQIYRCRMALEGMCAADFTRHAGQAEIDALLRIQQQLDECVNANTAEQFSRLNLDWHRTVIESARNPVAAGLLERLHVPIHRLMFESFYSANRLRAANADHHRIIAAILRRDADAAEIAMRNHVGDGLQVQIDIHREVVS